MKLFKSQKGSILMRITKLSNGITVGRKCSIIDPGTPDPEFNRTLRLGKKYNYKSGELKPVSKREAVEFLRSKQEAVSA